MFGDGGLGTGWHMDWEKALNMGLRVLTSVEGQRVSDALAEEVPFAKWGVLSNGPRVWDHYLQALAGALEAEGKLEVAVEHVLGKEVEGHNHVTSDSVSTPLPNQALYDLYEEHKDAFTESGLGVWPQCDFDTLAPRVGFPHQVLNSPDVMSMKFALDYVKMDGLDKCSLAHVTGQSKRFAQYMAVDYAEWFTIAMYALRELFNMINKEIVAKNLGKGPLLD
jgi:hypothetical protein